ncbi:hypothetical protein GOP47_0020629 [Adiantum capillus-veneris]|uniref:Uncharacterized protein n=1 Tax=Adiantum capillus-veneris TaxID=13818 RepID=A0A9D4UB47_ADICA|nr:hypothetical protein GOP47_0020629 [Adiantum capillus-veneris]
MKCCSLPRAITAPGWLTAQQLAASMLPGDGFIKLVFLWKCMFSAVLKPPLGSGPSCCFRGVLAVCKS